MRNLILFIGRYHFIFLYVLLSTISFYLLVNNNKFHGSSFLHSANSLVGSTYDLYADITGYFQLKEQNKILQEENRRLRDYSDMAYQSRISTEHQIIDKTYKQRYKFFSAEVINNTTNLQKNYLTLNIGSDQGVREGMSVASPRGVVGIVKAVSPNFSTVMSVLHIDTKVSAKLKKNGHYGSLSWSGKDYRFAELSEIPGHANFEIGDKVITSGYSTLFPEGLLVGKIKSFDKDKGQYFYKIKVELATPFRKIRHVYVIKDLEKEEKENLEQVTKENDK